MRYIDLLESEFLTDKDKIIKWMNESFKEFEPDKLIIESDGLVYDSHVELIQDTDKLSVQFKEVTGHFNCSYTNMTSLEGCPKIVGRNFYCNNTNISNLKHCPQIVKSNFFCYNTKKIIDPKEYRFALYSEIGGEISSHNQTIDDIINTYSGSANRKYWPTAINLLSKVEL